MSVELRTEVEQAGCVVCGTARPRKLVEEFPGGHFAECPGCGIHFGESVQTDLRAYYQRIWSRGNLGCQPYADKLQAAQDPALLERLVRTLPRFRWALSQLRRLPRGARVLDVGCGEGALLWGAQQMGLEPHGSDLAPPAVELARQLVGQDRVHVGTISDLPYPEGTFDALVALEVIEHLPNPRPFVETAARLLRPGGLLLLSTPNRHRVFAVLKRALGRPHSSTDYPPHHFTRWSARSLRELLAGSFPAPHVGSLPYGAEGAGARLAGAVLHLLTARRMGQTLWAVARRGAPGETSAS